MESAHRYMSVVPLLATLVIGCQANHYEIELTPDEKSLVRKLTCWREQGSQEQPQVVAFPEEDIERIAAAYDLPVPIDKARKHTFLAEFSEHMPDDVGGSGSYTHWETPLGNVSAYVERFRGNDDLVSEVEQRQWAVAQFADLLGGWLTAELQGEAGFPQLRQFLEGDFRQDLNNLSLYGWACGIVSKYQDDAPKDCLVRIGQYLCERDYFTPDQLPALNRAIQDLDGVGPAKLLTLLQRFVATKMGVADDEPIPACLHFLADLSALEASSASYLRETDEFKQLLESWEEKRKSNPEEEPPKPHVVWQTPAFQAFFSNVGPFGEGSDKLNVKLDSPSQPFLTNGLWDEQAGQTHWSRGIAPKDSNQMEFPTLLYAFWSIPNEAKQRTHFGQVVLDGEALGTYCMWYRGLSTEEANEWNEFVADSRPGEDFVKQLRAFRFSGERSKYENEQSDLAATARDLILRGRSENAPSKRGTGASN